MMMGVGLRKHWQWGPGNKWRKSYQRMIQIKKVWCKYGKIPGQGDGVNLFFVGEINVTHYFITNIGAGLPDACAE